jgi:septal ring factor EnvC (AmiA/AmiB activator)
MSDEKGDNIRKRIRELKTSLELSSHNDVLEFLLCHFDDKALEINIERAIIFEDGRRAGRAEMESRICAEVSERLKAVTAPTFRQEQELSNLRKEKEELQASLKASQERVTALEKDLKTAQQKLIDIESEDRNIFGSIGNMLRKRYKWQPPKKKT